VEVLWPVGGVKGLSRRSAAFAFVIEFQPLKRVEMKKFDNNSDRRSKPFTQHTNARAYPSNAGNKKRWPQGSTLSHRET